jgi:hypothetical protein
MKVAAKVFTGRARSAVRACVALASVAGLAAWIAAPQSASATEVKLLRQQNAASFAAGRLEGVSLDALGALQLADRMDKLASLGEPFLFSAAKLGDGWVVGTGNNGRVVKVDAQGRTTILFQAPEAAIFALWVDADGTVYAGSSPRGKVYRIGSKTPTGKADVFFDPHETYIWGLTRTTDGALLVATGTQGKLYRVEANGQGKVWYDASDTHLRALMALPGGAAMVGTASLGLIQRVAADGTVRTLYDSGGREVVAFTSAPDGTAYAAIANSEAALPEADLQAMQAAAAQAQGGGAPPSGSATVTAAPGEGATGTTKSPRSEIVRIDPNGVVESLWSFPDDTVYSLAWHHGRLWVGTGLEGRVFSFNSASAKMVLEKDADERQVMALLSDGDRLAMATTNAAALYRTTGGPERKGTYTSPALDAGQVSRFGVLRWRGETPRGTTLAFAFRSGISAEPDRTWSAWSEASDEHEITLAKTPPGRYLQWRVTMTASGDTTPRLVGIEASFEHLNLRPRIARFAAMDPGEVLVPQSFNPGAQVYEPAHPTKDGMFTTLGNDASAGEEARTKGLWKKGYRTLRWEATDPNDDKLVYTLEFRRESDPNGWLPMAKDLDDNWYSFDETALPSGVYRFRLHASDRKQNPDNALEAEQVTEPVVIDDLPPRLVSTAWESGRVRVTVEDDLSPLRTAEVSVDGGEWRPARPADGLLDGKREVLVIDLPASPKLVLLRVMDASWNVASFELGGQGESK